MPSNNRLDVSHLNKYITKVNNINIPKPCMVKYNFHGTKSKPGDVCTDCFLHNVLNCQIFTTLKRKYILMQSKKLSEMINIKPQSIYQWSNLLKQVALAMRSLVQGPLLEEPQAAVALACFLLGLAKLGW